MAVRSPALAWQRFGLGARPGDLDSPAMPAVASLLDEVAGASAPAELGGLPDGPSLFSRYTMQQAERKSAKAGPATPPVPAKPGGNAVRDAIAGELAARLKLARAVRIGFGERLALFWANHFTVGGAKPPVLIQAGAFEREAIRPHLAGRFENMLAAAESHPAMLLYLDNEQSMGPNSPAGRKRGKGLNENLAREILELHTLGPDGGYTQADVTSFANAITGWSVVGPNDTQATPGTFQFRPRMHEPDPKHLLGHDYGQDGRQQGGAILAELARLRPTAHHIAFKLVRHFIADEPPKPAVAAVAAAFERSGGDLMAVYGALLRTDAAFAAPPSKLRPPVEFALAAIRALGVELQPPVFVRGLMLMGQAPYRAPSPLGWSDDSKAWLAPGAIRTRLEFASLLAERTVAPNRPVDRAKAILGSLLSEETAASIEAAETAKQGLALLLMSPEFQRR